MTTERTSKHDLKTEDFGQDQTSDHEKSEPIVHELTRIEEFEIRSLLGRGGFGTVYLAHDDTLQRDVAIKIPHRSLVGRGGGAAEVYLQEARAIASLDHPNIIPVYRAASTPEIPCYIVTKLVRGCHLSQWARQAHPSLERIVELMASVADALFFAHKHGVVHRDIKPSNILVDEENRPYVADFGLALRDVDPQAGPFYVGTPAYMSPEQARGEGHRVDGRSDIFSLGVVFYGLLTGRRPFQSEQRTELFEQIMYSEPQHPLVINPHVAPELARICLKTLSKQTTARYQTAEALATDLRGFLHNREASILSSAGKSKPNSREGFQPIAQSQTYRIVPKGLRAFDTQDADFFLQLLPGPYDRDEVPELVRFWVSKIQHNGIEAQDPVGLIYGPSGCGKTSLVRAGIIPRLNPDVTAVYVEATANHTESDLVERLNLAFSAGLGASASQGKDIVELFSSLRRQRSRRFVIFIDQFEQWMFTHPDCSREPLVRALRQCDGENLQCILMVRDDFWMGVTRLMQTLDIPISEKVNVTSVDLFDVFHARKVLARFGAAYDRLPDQLQDLTPAQEQFLDEAIDYLEVGGRVICVRLALLAEMLKTRAWQNSTGLLKDGGVSIGTQFLEETFDSDNASRRKRIHAEGAHRVLRALLPEGGSRIKGAVCPEDELLVASGYRDRTYFRELLLILDRELHLITPADTSQEDSLSDDLTQAAHPGGYQLTHDFLIAPIRQWIAYRSRTTKQGKARLRLEEFTDLYQARPRLQSLPTLGEYVAIRKYNPPSSLTDRQRVMMSAALRWHLRSASMWICLAAILIAAAGGLFSWQKRRTRENADRAALTRLLDVNMAEAVRVAGTLHDSDLAREEARELVQDASAEDSRRARAALLLVETLPEAAELLADYALEGAVEDVVSLAQSGLFPYEQARQELLAAWRDQSLGRSRAIRAACLLANDKPRVAEHFDAADLARIQQLLLAENPIWIELWGRGFEPLGKDLVVGLSEYVSDDARTVPSLNAVNLLVAFAGNDVPLLVSLVGRARLDEIEILTQALAESGDEATQSMHQAWSKLTEPIVPKADSRTPWGSPWWCVGRREPLPAMTSLPLSPDFQVELRAYEAVIGEQSVMLHKLPSGQLVPTADSLEACGYRVAEIVPYSVGEERFIFLLTLRDQIKSSWAIDLDPEQLANTSARFRAQGLKPDSVVAYQVSPGAEHRLACVWLEVPPDSGLIDSDMYIHASGERHEETGWGPLSERGLRLNRSSVLLTDADGKEFITSVRWLTKQAMNADDDWNMKNDRYLANLQYRRSGAPLVARWSRRDATDPKRGRTPIWWDDLPVESELIDYNAQREHLRQAQTLLEQGYYPVAIDATVIGTDLAPQFQSIWWRPIPASESQIEHSQQQCNYAIGLYLLDHFDQVEAALKDKFGANLRGAVIAGLAGMNARPNWLLQQLADVEQDAMLRRSCAFSLALYTMEELSVGLRVRAGQQLPAAYQQATDPGLRSALELLADRWQVELEGTHDGSWPGERTSIAGDRLVIIHPTDPVWLGSPPNENGRDGGKERQIPVHIGHSYAIATREVTVAQFRRFRPGYMPPENYAATDDCPAIDVSWFDAVAYCRWLGEQEWLRESQQCYPPQEEIRSGMRLPAGYEKRIGYRLPSESEWEYACRGGRNENRWFGFQPEHLNDYAWTASNSGYRLHPVASRLCNDYGLFDMLGNAMEWCHSPPRPHHGRIYSPVLDSGVEILDITEDTALQTRGAAMLYQPLDARASQRNEHKVNMKRVYLSFRICRTIVEN